MTNPSAVRVGIYARVSTKDQSCEMQLRDIRAYCAARGYEQITEYTDTGVSGTKDRRPGLDKIMGDIRKRKVDMVIVWRFDRFARSTKHLVLALEEFKALGVHFISYQENMDTGSPLGQALFTIVAAIAQLERDIIVERINAGVRNARAKGVTLGRPKRIVDREKIIKLLAEGMSRHKIADKLGISYTTVRARIAEVARAHEAERIAKAASMSAAGPLLESDLGK